MHEEVFGMLGIPHYPDSAIRYIPDQLLKKYLTLTDVTMRFRKGCAK